MTRVFFLAGTLCGVMSAAAPPLQALPSFRSLYSDRAGYRANCTVCHSPVNARLNPYGAEFQRLGEGRAALETLDVMDPDRDGFMSKDEILSRANPGEGRSTPDHPGEWLAAVQPTPFPHKALKKVFRKSAAITVVEKPLALAQVAAAERSLGHTLRDAERFPTVFIVNAALSPGLSPRPAPEAPWRVAYATTEPNPSSVFVVVLGRGSLLGAVRPVSVYGDQRFRAEAYLKQFAGRSLETLQGVAAPPGAEAQNASVLAAVRRAVRLIELSVPEEKR